MIDGYRWHRGWMTAAQTARWRALIVAQDDRFVHVRAKAGMNLPYLVLDGHRVGDELTALADGPMRAAVEASIGAPVELMRDPRRAVRVQRYRKGHGFKWHLDGGRFGAIFTVENQNGGATEVLSPRASLWLRPAPYLLFPFPRILELAGPRALNADAGDLLVLDGGRIIHRGTNPGDGERIVIAASYDPIGTRRPRVWDWIARQLNY